MSDYKSERGNLLSDEGITRILETLLRIQQATKVSGCCIAGKVMSGESFLFHNAVDWLVEHGYVRVLGDKGFGQEMVLAVTAKGAGAGER